VRALPVFVTATAGDQTLADFAQSVSELVVE